MYTRVTYGKRNGAYNYSEFIVDTEGELANLPTSVSRGTSGNDVYEVCSVGSRAYVTDLRKSYILSNANQWKLMTNYASAGGGGGVSGEITAEDDGNGNVSIM